MEYNTYEKWDADTQKIQADLEDADRKLKQAMRQAGDGDVEAAKAVAQCRVEYDRLLKKSRDHMKKMPSRFETPPK